MLSAYDRIPRQFTRDLRPLVRQIPGFAGNLNLGKSILQRATVLGVLGCRARLDAAMHEACQMGAAHESVVQTSNEDRKIVSIWRQSALDLPVPTRGETEIGASS